MADVDVPKIENYKEMKDNYSVISSSKREKFFASIIKNKHALYQTVERLKRQSHIVFYRFNFENEIFELIFPSVDGKQIKTAFISTSFVCLNYFDENMNFKDSSSIHSLENVSNQDIQVLVLIIHTLKEMNFHSGYELDSEDKKYIKISCEEVLNSLKNNNLEQIDKDDTKIFQNESYEILEELNSSQDLFHRIDIHSHDLPAFNLRKKPVRKKNKVSGKKSKKTSKSNINISTEYRKEIEILIDTSLPWFDRFHAYKLLALKLHPSLKEHKLVKKFKLQIEEEFKKELDKLQLVDGYGEQEEQKLWQLVDSIINDKLARRTSNKLIVGPQGTGKSTFSRLLANLMRAKLVILECGPLTDNNDFYGSYEIHVEPETRQAITTFTYNGFMHASKLANEGERVVIAVEEYNLLPSETLLKQLNRFFQDRVISALGGRFEIDNHHNKDDLIIILTGNHEFNQDWLEDVGLIRRFDFFEFQLPSTKSVTKCLAKYVKSPITGQSISFALAERIAEIRDDLVASLNERTIRPILSKEIKYPDLYTLRNFSLDLLHRVDLKVATKRWLIKIILGGNPADVELREEYDSYAEVILRTIQDRIPENYEEILSL